MRYVWDVQRPGAEDKDSAGGRRQLEKLAAAGLGVKIRMGMRSAVGGGGEAQTLGTLYGQQGDTSRWRVIYVQKGDRAHKGHPHRPTREDGVNPLMPNETGAIIGSKDCDRAGLPTGKLAELANISS